MTRRTPPTASDISSCPSVSRPGICVGGRRRDPEEVYPKILILGCEDPLMWYASFVGETVPYVREEKDHFISREPDGYVNIVKKSDAEIVGRLKGILCPSCDKLYVPKPGFAQCPNCGG